ncbi:MAG: hypothetical protein ACR2KV_09965 [Solirubrobacteraceae bacterium]
MRRRRPTAVYRVLDEEDLLSGTDYLDSAGFDCHLAGSPGEPRGAEIDPWAAQPEAQPVARHGRAAPRRQVLIACAGALVVAVLVARLASFLLAGAGASRGGHLPRGHAAGAPRAAIVPNQIGFVLPAAIVARPTGAVPPAGRGGRASRPMGGQSVASRDRATARIESPAVKTGRPAVRSRHSTTILAGQASPARSPGAAARPHPPAVAGPQEFGFER